MAIRSFVGPYCFLSNFHRCNVKIGEFTYPSAEHAYQAQKSVNDLMHECFTRLPTAGHAKRLGNTLNLPANWHEVKVAVMRQVVLAKFEQNRPLRMLLISTGKEELIEGNTWGDVFWGVVGNQGHNHLGKILMDVRGALA